MNWTDERVETLKKLWLDGLSAGQIAKQLGGVTRNAVIGKVHRLGLSGREMPSHPIRMAKFRPPRRPITATPARAYGHSAKPSRRSTVSTPLAIARVELPGTATLFTLGAHMCKWPIGDPSADDFTFCGRRAGERDSFCIDHARIAYQAPQGRKATSVAELTRSLRRYI